MAKVLFYFAPGLEECEGLITVDLLRRAMIEVTIASITDGLMISGSHSIAVRCEKLASETDASAYDAVVLPGGGRGTENLYESALVRQTVEDFASAGKLVCAICAAPSVPGRMGLLQGKTATCYPGFEDKLLGANYVAVEAVRDGNFITASGLGAAIPFALEIITALVGAETAQHVKESIQYRH